MASLISWLDHDSIACERRLRVNPRVIRVRDMRHKWGSCSSAGTLASDLASQDSDFQDFVLVHELLHLRVSTHGRLFKASWVLTYPDGESWTCKEV
ncbi:hypothetical protein D9M72_290870 [compost metagenome]